ncbi:MAG: alkaline phosphatase family protein [Lachnospiraceae bacterium]
MELFYRPDWNRSVTALANSILTHYDCPGNNPTLPEADLLLQQAPRNIVLILLDGLGTNILHRHLGENSFLRRHLKGTLSSVFPPTTAAAATALETGLFPSQSGWLGWSIFWPPIQNNVALYPNTLDNGKPASSVHIGNTELYVQKITRKIRHDKGIPAFTVSENGDICAGTIPEVSDCILQICSEKGPHFIYAYLNEPDHFLHGEGCESLQVTRWLEDADAGLEVLSMQCPETLFLLTADHGFIDVESLCLEDYPELEDCLLRKPSIEPRALNLFLKENRRDEFLLRWKETIGDAYTLYTRRQALEQHLFGPEPVHPRLEEMLGDYIAIAKTPLTLFPNRSYLNFMKATHGGMTPQELTVPFIYW